MLPHPLLYAEYLTSINSVRNSLQFCIYAPSQKMGALEGKSPQGFSSA